MASRAAESEEHPSHFLVELKHELLSVDILEIRENTSSHDSSERPGKPEQEMQNLRSVRIVLR